MLEEELSYLYGLMREGIKLDLGVMKSFSEMLGHPENDFRSIHVAGTNGKGSTSSFIFNMLRQKHRSGLYTSPHLVKFNERIIMDKLPIGDDYIREFVGKYRNTIDKLAAEDRNPTFFETTTMMAFSYFSERKAEYGAIEVGLGGRLDSTNIVMPEVGVITHIGYEHADKLGCSLTSIATEKGGIIKRGVPVILADTKPEVVRTIKSICSVRDSRLLMASEDSKVKNLQLSEKGTSFELVTSSGEYEIQTPLLGEFQVENIATAVLAVENSEASLSKADIERGIGETRWPGRLEIIREEPRVILDCSHNPPAAVSLANTFRKVFAEKPLIVAGMLSDKDAFSYFSVLSKISDEIIFTAPREENRAMDPVKLDRNYGGLFRSHKAIKDPVEAYKHALDTSRLILVTGSIYLVGVIKEFEEGGVMPFALN